MSPITIDQCPTEVLQEIFLNLSETRYRRDLQQQIFPHHQNLFLVNRRFYEAAKPQYYSSVNIFSEEKSERFANLIRINASVAQCVLDLHLKTKYIEKVDENEGFLAALEFIFTQCKNINQLDIHTDFYGKDKCIDKRIIKLSLADDIIIKCIESLDKSILKSLIIRSDTCSTFVTERISSFSWPALTLLWVDLPTSGIATAQIVSRCPNLRELDYNSLRDNPLDCYVLQALIDHSSYLRSLIFRGNNTSEETVASFIKKKGSQLEKLDLINHLGNEIPKNICYYAQSIKDVRINCKNMEDFDGVIELLKTCRNLTYLELRYCRSYIELCKSIVVKIHGIKLQMISKLIEFSDNSLYPGFDCLLRITEPIEGGMKHREVKLHILEPDLTT